MTACNMHKNIYANDKMHINIKMKTKNIYMAPIYMYDRLGLGVYSLYIYRVTNLEASTHIGADAFIYTLESWRARLNLAHAAQCGYRKL